MLSALRAKVRSQLGDGLRSIGQSLGWRSGAPIVLSACLVSATVTVGTAALVWQARDRAETEAGYQLRGLAQVMGDQVDRWFQSVQLLQQIVVQHAETIQMDSASAVKERGSTESWHLKLKEWSSFFPDIAVLFIIDSEGNVVNNSAKWPFRPTVLTERDYFAEVRRRNDIPYYIGRPVIDKITGKWMVFISRRLASAAGEFIGCVTVGVTISNLEAFYQDVKIDDRMAIALFRRDGVLLARYPQHELALGVVNASSEGVFKRFATSSLVTSRMKSLIDGEDRYITAKISSRFPLVVSVSRSSEAVLAPWKHEAAQMIAVAAIMDLCVAIATALSLRRIRARDRLANAESYLARHDALTGLANRLSFNEFMTRQIVRYKLDGGDAMLLLLDLDRFKEVNDTLGHGVGDQLLQAVATRLERMLSSDVFLARLGGDEFAFVTGSEQHQDVGALAALILHTLSEPFSVASNEVVVEASIGMVLISQCDGNPETILRRADLALYSAKDSGKNNFKSYCPEMEQELRFRRELEVDLRHALTRGELELAFQPLLHLSSGQISGCEALIRWKHPVRGYIPPSEFIPVAEETGLIGTIGEWVLKAACKAAVSWPPHIMVAVNLSPIQFRTRDIVSEVRAAIAESGIAADRIELEITESALIDDSKLTEGALLGLRALGASIVLDDFGTGYSSLNYLRKYPFQKIKIDRSFVGEIETSQDCLTIVEITLLLAKRLDLLITAEGVETVEQLDRLKALGCTQAQGYLISRPLSADGVLDFVRTQSGNAQAA
jgi:diguanylate cyclase (GGDEF)-like protein